MLLPLVTIPLGDFYGGQTAGKRNIVGTRLNEYARMGIGRHLTVWNENRGRSFKIVCAFQTVFAETRCFDILLSQRSVEIQAESSFHINGTQILVERLPSPFIMPPVNWAPNFSIGLGQTRRRGIFARYLVRISTTVTWKRSGAKGVQRVLVQDGLNTVTFADWTRGGDVVHAMVPSYMAVRSDRLCPLKLRVVVRVGIDSWLAGDRRLSLIRNDPWVRRLYVIGPETPDNTR
jgi:hypothetical protein